MGNAQRHVFLNNGRWPCGSLGITKVIAIWGPFIFYEKGGAGGIWGGGGGTKKNWLERGGQPKNNEGKGELDEKIRLKIG